LDQGLVVEGLAQQTIGDSGSEGSERSMGRIELG